LHLFLIQFGSAFSPLAPHAESLLHGNIGHLILRSNHQTTFFGAATSKHCFPASIRTMNSKEGHTLRRSSRLSQARASTTSSSAKDNSTKSKPPTKPPKAAKRKRTNTKSNTTSTAKASTKHTEAETSPTPLLNESNLLLDLGTLIKGKLIKRPSATVKSPYVSDVMIIDENGEEGEIVLAHSPALDVGGLCVPNSTVFMSERPPGGKTSHSIELLLSPAPNCATVEDDSGILVGAHPQLGEKLAEIVLQKGLLQDVIGYGAARLDTSKRTSSPKKKKKKEEDDEVQQNGVVLRRQVTYGDSRVDFELTDYSQEDNTKARSLVEVKNVVCSDVAASLAPEKTGPNHCVITSESEEYSRTAIFPWGRIGQTFEGNKVVSERAIKHLRNLGNLTVTNEHMNAIVLFVINRSDCEHMRACHEQCPTFAAELKKTAEKGVLVTSFRVRWTREGKAYFDGIIPVTL
jgi:hypothetical protein